MVWFWLSLVALVCWSGSDLFSKIGSRPTDKQSHWKMVSCVGLVMLLHALFEIFVSKVPITFEAVLQYLPASLLYIASMILGYCGLRYIELSVSSPICNSSGAISALLMFIFLSQRLSTLHTVAVIIICVAVTGLGFIEAFEDEKSRILRQENANVKYAKSFVAILLPVLYCVLDALGTFADAFILETLDEAVANVAYELTFGVMGLFGFIWVVAVKREKYTLKADLPKLAAGIFETGGQFAYIYALGANGIAAAPIISAYCVLSMVWGRVFLKEKLSYLHYIALALAVGGIVMLAFE